MMTMMMRMMMMMITRLRRRLFINIIHSHPTCQIILVPVVVMPVG
jgi:hypothetical protein